MATNYKVTVTMTPYTALTLLGQGSQLVTFAATQGTDKQALPLVWKLSASFGTIYTLNWMSSYGAFASSTTIAPGAVFVPPPTSEPIALGQTFSVAAGPLGRVVAGQIPGLITLNNTTSSPFSVGLELMQVHPQPSTNELVPLCAYPLYGSNTQVLLPLPTVVMFFTTVPLQVGEAYSPEMLVPGNTGPMVAINLSSQNTAAVAYDLNGGWSWQSGQPAQIILPSQVISTLIQPTSPATRALIRRVLRARARG